MITTVYRDMSEYLDTKDGEMTCIKYVKNDYKLEKDLKRGDIIVVDFGINIGREKSGIRLAIVISSDEANKHSENVIVAPTTKFPKEKMNKHGVVEVKPTQFVLSNNFYKNLEKTSVVQMENIRSVSKKRIIGTNGNLSRKSLEDMKLAMINTFL